jgi:hypothetical protein
MVGASLLLDNRVRSRKVNDSTLRFPLGARNAQACVRTRLLQKQALLLAAFHEGE